MTFLGVKIIQLEKSLEFIKSTRALLVDKNAEVLQNSDIRIYLNVYEYNKTLYVEEIAYTIITSDNIFILLNLVDILNITDISFKWEYDHRYKDKICRKAGKQGYIAPDIKDMGLSQRVLNILKRNGIKKFNKLADIDRLTLQSYTGLGKIAYNEIKETLCKYGIFLDQ